MNPVRKFCKHHNISQNELARLTGHSQSSANRYYHYKNGDSSGEPSLKIKFAMAYIDIVGLDVARDVADKLMKK